MSRVYPAYDFMVPAFRPSPRKLQAVDSILRVLGYGTRYVLYRLYPTGVREGTPLSLVEVCALMEQKTYGFPVADRSFYWVVIEVFYAERSAKMGCTDATAFRFGVVRLHAARCAAPVPVLPLGAVLDGCVPQAPGIAGWGFYTASGGAALAIDGYGRDQLAGDGRRNHAQDEAWISLDLWGTGHLPGSTLIGPPGKRVGYPDPRMNVGHGPIDGNYGRPRRYSDEFIQQLLKTREVEP